jgi:Zn-dependent protease with chaperone function/archaellum component FlaF (FlaF/FlaG flagellin family)
MWLIAIQIFYNAYMLLGLSALFIAILKLPINMVTEAIFLLLPYIIVATLSFIGFTPLATPFISFFMGGRNAIGRETNRLNPIISDVLVRCNDKFNTTYKLEQIKLKMVDNKTLNAYALGHNVLGVNQGTLDILNDDELSAILAHEVAHLYYRDSSFSISLIFASFMVRVIMAILTVITIISTAIGSVANPKSESGAVVKVLMFVPLIIFCYFYALNWIGNKLFIYLNMKISRKAEYRADAFASSLGYKDSLVSALEKIHASEVVDDSFFGKLNASHPATMLRIGAIEDNKTIDLPKPITHKKLEQQYLVVLLVGLLIWCAMLMPAYLKKYHGIKDVKAEVVKQVTNSEVVQQAITITKPKVEASAIVIAKPEASKIVKVEASKVQSLTKKVVAEVKTVDKKVIKEVKKVEAKTKSTVANIEQVKPIAPKVDEMVHIEKVYKVSDTQYTITYTYKGAEKVVIRHSAPDKQTMTMAEFNNL